VNRFRLDRYVPPGRGADAYELAVPVIDDVPLFERLGDRFPGLSVREVAWPSRQWLGAPTVAEDGRAVILDGECGEPGCCGVFARITVKDSSVRWADFFARGSPRLPDGLSFSFERGKYEAALKSVAARPSIAWSPRE
jgi:hypothetical protein